MIVKPQLHFQEYITKRYPQEYCDGNEEGFSLLQWD